MPVSGTVHIDLVIVLRMFAARLATVANVTMLHLGLAPAESGDSTQVVRVQNMTLDWADGRSMDGMEESATLGMELTFIGTKDAEGGGLNTVAMMFNRIKQALDREPLTDATTSHRADVQIGNLTIIDDATAETDGGGDHGALRCSCTLRARVIRTNSTALETSPPV
jgi:hypothetical protein